MPSLDQHQSQSFVKLLYIGHSGVGKTGSLVSLLKAGYRLRFLDMDNGLTALRKFAERECPDKLKNVDFETLRDKPKMGPLGPVVVQPKAYVGATRLLEKWTDGTDPAEWGPDTVLVLDSLTAFGMAAFEWARGMNPSGKDPRQWYFAAQQSLEATIGLLTSEAFHCNVIVITHIGFQELQEGMVKGFPTAIGTALGAKIPRYFDTLVSAEVRGKSRVIKTTPTSLLDLKNPAPFTMKDELPLETGMATIFETIKGDSSTSKKNAA